MDGLATPQHLREQAKRFREAADKLIDAANVLDGTFQSAATPNGTKHTRRNGETRVESLRKILASGPLFKKELILKSGMPLGTLNSLLADKTKFVRDDQGRWCLKGA